MLTATNFLLCDRSTMIAAEADSGCLASVLEGVIEACLISKITIESGGLRLPSTETFFHP